MITRRVSPMLRRPAAAPNLLQLTEQQKSLGLPAFLLSQPPDQMNPLDKLYADSLVIPPGPGSGPAMPAAGGAGGGHRSVRHGGGAFAEYAPDDGKRIDAHLYGDTFAEESQGHSGPLSGPYTGPHGFGDLDEFYEDNPNTPTAKQQHASNVILNPSMPITTGHLPRDPLITARKYGGDVKAGKLHIVGEEGPELFVPDQPGTIIPNASTVMRSAEDPSKLLLKPNQYGTGSSTGAIPPPPKAYIDMGGGNLHLTKEGKQFVDMLDAKRAKGEITLEEEIEANDLLATGTPMDAVWSGLQRTASPSPAMPAGRSRFESDEQWAARREMMNPDDIVVGFTPRDPLHGPAERAPEVSREERMLARVERNVMRAARSDMRLGARLLAGKAQAEADLQKARLDHAKAAETMRHNKALEQSAATRAGLETNQRNLQNTLTLQQIHQNAQPPAAVTFQQAPGSDMGVVYSGSKAMSVARAMQPPSATMRETAPGSGEFYNPALGTSDRFELQPPVTMPPMRIPWMGRTPAFTPPGQEPKYKPAPQTTKKADQQKMRLALVAGMSKLDDLLEKTGITEETEKRLKELKAELMADFDGDGVPDVLEGGGTGSPAPGAKPQPSSGFLNAVTPKR